MFHSLSRPKVAVFAGEAQTSTCCYGSAESD